jgi:hypothetical protein
MKHFLTVIFLFLIVGAASAQEAGVSSTSEYPHHEFYVGAGVVNDNQVLSLAIDLTATLLTLGYAVQPYKYTFITPSVGYKYWFNKRVGLGLHYAFDATSVKVIHHHEGNAYESIHKRYFHTLAAEFGVNYVNKPVFQLYGNMGMGITLVNFSKNDLGLGKLPFFNMNIVPLGMRFGKDIAGFVEIGWGYKGILNAGLSVKL